MKLKSLFKAMSILGLAFCVNAANAQILEVGTEAGYEPFEFIDENDEFVGFDIDVMNAIAEAQGAKVEFINLPFDLLLTSLKADELHAAISTISITDERKAMYDFSRPYFKGGISMLVKSNTPYTNVNDLKNKTICAQEGTTSFEIAKSLTNKVVGVVIRDDGLTNLKSNKCEALIDDLPVNLYYLSKNNVTDLKDLGNIEAEYYGIAVTKGDTQTLNFINEGLSKIEASGKLQELKVKWFGNSIE